MAWVRFGIYNSNSDTWPRSVKVDLATYNSLLDAINTERIAGTPPAEANALFRAAIGTGVGNKWSNETDDWFLRTFAQLFPLDHSAGHDLELYIISMFQ